MNDRKATRRRDIGLTAHSVSCSPHMLMLRVFTMLALATMIASPSSAQSVWDLAGDGNWNVATNWAPVGVPNSSTTDVIINTGANRTVSLNMDATIRDLLVGNGDILHVNSGRSLTSHGNILNDGLIVINPTGGNITTTLAVSQPMSLSGSGILRLGRDTQAYITGSVIHHGDTHTIEGVGRILADLVNNGTLRADATLGTGASLSLLNNNVTNNGLLWATENSTLALTSSQIVNHNGVIRADGAGSLVELNGDTTIIGGTLQTFNGGFFATGTTGTKTLIDVHNQGTIHLNSNRTLAAEGALVNDGLIRINPTTGNLATTFTASDVLLITGHGVIELNRVGTRANITGSQITQGADHTIHGVGQIEASLINYGTVRADGTLGQGTTLDLISGAKTNLGTFSAVNGGTLQVTSGLLTNYDAGTQTLTGGAYHVMGSSTMRLVGVNVQTLDAHITLDGSGSNFYSGGSGTASGLAPLETIGTGGSLFLLNGRQLATNGGLLTYGVIDLDGAATKLTVLDDFQQLAGVTQLNDGATLQLMGLNNLISGGTLGGNGNVIGDLILGAGSLLSPGLSPGQLTFDGDLVWHSGATIVFDLGANALDSDLINVVGQLLKSGTDPWLFDFANNGWQIGQTYDLISFGITDFLASDFAVANGGGFSGTFAISGNKLQFTLTAIPEPSAAVLFLMTVLGCITASSRRRSV